MNQQDENLPPLSLPRSDVVGDNAFDGDVLQRDRVADKLTGYIDRLREGAVLAIDAPWGEGKTWFGRNWAKRLEDEKRTVVFIDAFEQDYVEDPFLLLAAEIAEVMDDKSIAEDLRKTAVGVMKAIIPMVPKVMLNIGGRVALGSNDLSKDIGEGFEAVSNEIASATGKLIEDKIEKHAQEKESLQHFKNELTKFAVAQDKPVVIIIDELDRCKPTFAVQLIERVKHLFDVPNLVFVLLLNRNQLEKAVKGVYGAETEASRYLGKFVNFFFRLPTRTSFDPTAYKHVEKYISDVFKRYHLENNYLDFKDCLSAMAITFKMSLRDIEQAIALYVFAQPSYISNNFLAYAIALKIVNPELFQRLIEGDGEAHNEARDYISTQKRDLMRTRRIIGDYLNPIYEWHEFHRNSFKDEGELSSTCKQVLADLREYDSKEQLFPFLAEQIDLSIG